MTKAEIAAAVADKHGIPEVKAKALVDTFFNTIATAVEQGEVVTVRGFGSFKRVARAARTISNMLGTGKEVKIPARSTIGFKPSSKALA